MGKVAKLIMITTEIKQTTISKPISLSGVGLHTGQEVKLPYTTKDFRGDEVIVVGFNAPKHQASTGRIHTDDGMSYFPSVVGLKIVGHEFDDNLNEGRMKEIVHDAQEMDKEEFEEKYGDDYDYNEIKKDYI